MSKILTLVLSNTTEDDYDGLPETVKQCSGNIIDDVTAEITLEQNVETITCPGVSTDEAVKTAYKAFLTTKEYAWDNEA